MASYSFYPPDLETVITHIGTTALSSPTTVSNLPGNVPGFSFYFDQTPSPDDETVPCVEDYDGEQEDLYLVDENSNQYPSYSLVGGRPIKRPTT